MTSNGTPGDEHNEAPPEQDGPAAGGFGDTPPPPQWLTEQQPSGANLLPDVPPPPFPADSAAQVEESETQVDEPETLVDEPVAGPAAQPGEERTQVFSRDEHRPAAEAPAGVEPPPLPPFPGPAGSPAPLAFPYAQPIPGVPATPAQPVSPQPVEPPTQVDDAQAAEPPQTVVEPVQPPQTVIEPVQPAAPPAPMPSAPAPFPYAQEIPAGPPPQAASPEPFPYAQEIPTGPPPQPAGSPEPFPYAQEIPGGPPPQPSAPFPYAQEVPGGPVPQPGEVVAVQPVAPPPVIEEPWRTQGKPKKQKKQKQKGGGSGRGKKIGFGLVAGLAAAALVAGGAYVLLGDGSGTAEKDGGARLAGAVFAADPAARFDGRDQELTDVAAAGTTVVAVGNETDPAARRGVFLVSTDGGRTFKGAGIEGSGDEPLTTGVPEHIAGGPQGWVAIGSRPGGGGAVWTSKDGATWQRQPNTVGDAFGPGNRVARVITTDRGFMAVGENSRKRDFSDSVPAAWFSADGRTWQALTGPQVGIPVRGKVVLEDASSSGGVLLLRSLHAPNPGKPSFRRVWSSTDQGRTWTPAKVPAPKGTRDLITGGGKAGLITVREVRSGKKVYGRAYVSANGIHWSERGELEPSGYRKVWRLIGTDDGFVALVDAGRSPLILRSSDGRSWKDAGKLADGRGLAGITATGAQTIVVGRTQGDSDLNAMVTVRDASGTEVPVDPAKISGAFRPDRAVTAVAANATQAVAVGSTGGDAAVWTSSDGTTWSRGAVTGGITRPSLQRLSSVATGGAGWLAVGSGGGSPQRPLVLTSADGRAWQAADTIPMFTQRGSQNLTTFGAAAGPAGYVVVGEDGFSAATWFSTDLKTWQRGSGAGRNDLTVNGRSNRWLRAVAAGPSGFVAVGGFTDPRARGDRGQRPAAWTSSDGKKWTMRQLTLPSGLTDGSLTQVAAKGGTLVAAGQASGTAGSAPFAYVSADGGATWRESKLPAPASATELSVLALAATASGFVAAGTSGRPGAADVVSWTSADGVVWEAETPGGTGLGGDGDQQITGLAVFKGSVLGVGRTAGAEDEQPVLWSRPAP